MRLNRFSILAICFALTVSTFSATSASATPAEGDAEVATCATTASPCLDSFKWKNGATWEDLNSDISAGASLHKYGTYWSISLDLNDTAPTDPDSDGQDLSRLYAAGTLMRVVIDTGSWNPSFQLVVGEAGISSWNTSLSNGHYLTTVEFETVPYTTVGDPSTCDIDCSSPDSLIDHASAAHMRIFHNANYWFANFWSGSSYSSNGLLWGYPTFNPSTKSLEFEVNGPALTAAGADNEFFYNALLPDTLLRKNYGVVSADIVDTITVSAGGADLTNSSTISHVDSPVPGLFVHVVGLQPSASHLPTLRSLRTVASATTTATKGTISLPELGKVKLPKPNKPSVVKVSTKRGKTKVDVQPPAGSTVPFAKYNVRCTMGKKVHSGTNSVNQDEGTVTVRISGLTKGTWQCQVRAIGRDSTHYVNSGWSSTKLFKVKK